MATIYEYITKVFPCYNRLEKTSPMLKSAIETELGKQAGFVRSESVEGQWAIDPNWDGKQQQEKSDQGYVWTGGKFNCEHCVFTTPFEMAVYQHVASFHPNKIRPSQITDTDFLTQHGIRVSLQVKLVQVRLHTYSRLYFCAIFAWFFMPVLPFVDLLFIHASTNATDDHKYSP